MKLKKAYVESSMATVNKKDPSRNTKAISFMDMSQTSLERILDTGERTFVKALWAFSIRFLIASLTRFRVGIRNRVGCYLESIQI